MLKVITDTVTVIGMAGLVAIFAYLTKLASGYVKSKADTTKDVQKKNELEKVSNGLRLLSQVATSQVTYLDRFQDGGQSKKAAAISHLTEVANKHGLNISASTMDGMVENALNSLRAKQGLPLPNVVESTDPVKSPSNPVKNIVNSQPNDSADYVGDVVEQKQSKPFAPGDVKYED
jgi:LL-H family phage holin